MRRNALATAALIISLTQLALSTPLIIGFYLHPDVSIAKVSETPTFIEYQVKNTGSGDAHNLDIEFDAFAPVASITSRPDLDFQSNQKAARLLAKYPLLRAGESAYIDIAVGKFDQNDVLAVEFGTIEPYFIRSDERAGAIDYGSFNAEEVPN